MFSYSVWQLQGLFSLRDRSRSNTWGRKMVFELNDKRSVGTFVP
jgi:hypothetical protein